MTDIALHVENPCRPRHFKPGSCTPQPLDGPAKESLEVSHTRLLIAAALFCVAFLAIAVRLVALSGFEASEARIAHVRPAATALPGRTDIVDRNGKLLATTIEKPSLYANPHEIREPQRVAAMLARALPDTSEAEFLAKLTEDRSFVWLKHRLTPRQQAAVIALGIPGIEFKGEDARVYPEASLFAHVVGFAGDDNKGLAGIELRFDDTLRGGRERLELSLDARLQYILREEILQQIAQFHADGGFGIIMDVHTGEIAAMVSLPDFDPNAVGTVDPDALFNRATSGVYEMGSVFKIFTAAMALETRAATLTQSFDATHPIKIGRFTIHDDHAQHRWLTVPEIFMYSSNIGAAKMAVEVGTARQKEFLGRLGLLTAPVLEVPVAEPLVPGKNWATINTMTIAFGHGISVTPVQLVTAASAVVNGGILHRPTLLKHPEGAAIAGQQVLSERTSADMRRLFRLVVERGTGKFANAPGYLVGGKTGTAEKVSGKHYDRHELLSSFLGAFPINDPRYIVLVSIDEPHGNAGSYGNATGGWVAAPAVSRTIQHMASIVGIQPVDEDSPEIRRSLMVDLPTPQARKLAAN